MEAKRSKPYSFLQEINPEVDYYNWFRDEIEELKLPRLSGENGERRSSRVATAAEQQPAPPPAPGPVVPRGRHVAPRAEPLFADILPDSDVQVQEQTLQDYVAFSIRAAVHWPVEGEDHRFVDTDYQSCYASSTVLSRLLRRCGGVMTRKSPSVVQIRFTNPKVLLQKLGKETTLFTKHRPAGPNHLIMVGPGVPLDVFIRVKRTTELYYRAVVPEAMDLELGVEEKVLAQSPRHLVVVDMDDGTIQVGRIGSVPFNSEGNLTVEWYDTFPSCTRRTVISSLGKPSRLI